jgi:acetyl-CoA acetyltransferase
MTTFSARDAAAGMWARTELRPSDVDVAELYDGFSILTMVWLEELGLCGKGESGPLNTSGGQLSAGRLHGFGMLHEACVQLRGEGGARQVPTRPEVAAVAAGGGPIAGCMLLTRGPS